MCDLTDDFQIDQSAIHGFLKDENDCHVKNLFKNRDQRHQNNYKKSQIKKNAKIRHQTLQNEKTETIKNKTKIS